MRRSWARSTVGCLIAAVVLVGAVPAQAGTGTFVTKAKWKNCETKQSAIRVKATFPNVASYYGKGRYLVKKEIRWDVLKSGMWRREDSTTQQTQWVKINATAQGLNWDFVTSIGDRTGWGNLYDSRWRAHVTFKLIKNRKGPKDKRVDTIEIFPTKGLFAEVGSCGGIVPGEA